MKYWPATTLAEAPGCHPQAKEDLRNCNRREFKPSPEHAATIGQAAFVIASNGMAVSRYQPLALPPPSPDSGEIPQPVYLALPSDWEWRSLERAALIEVPAGYYFLLFSLH